MLHIWISCPFQNWMYVFMLNSKTVVTFSLFLLFFPPEFQLQELQLQHSFPCHKANPQSLSDLTFPNPTNLYGTTPELTNPGFQLLFHFIGYMECFHDEEWNFLPNSIFYIKCLSVHWIQINKISWGRKM